MAVYNDVVNKLSGEETKQKETPTYEGERMRYDTPAGLEEKKIDQGNSFLETVGSVIGKGASGLYSVAKSAPKVLKKAEQVGESFLTSNYAPAVAGVVGALIGGPAGAGLAIGSVKGRAAQIEAEEDLKMQAGLSAQMLDSMNSGSDFSEAVQQIIKSPDQKTQKYIQKNGIQNVAQNVVRYLNPMTMIPETEDPTKRRIYQNEAHKDAIRNGVPYFDANTARTVEPKITVPKLFAYAVNTFGKDVYRDGESKLSMNDPANWQKIYDHFDKERSNQRSPFYGAEKRDLDLAFKEVFGQKQTELTPVQSANIEADLKKAGASREAAYLRYRASLLDNENEQLKFFDFSNPQELETAKSIIRAQNSGQPVSGDLYDKYAKLNTKDFAKYRETVASGVDLSLTKLVQLSQMDKQIGETAEVKNARVGLQEIKNKIIQAKNRDEVEAIINSRPYQKYIQKLNQLSSGLSGGQ